MTPSPQRKSPRPSTSRPSDCPDAARRRELIAWQTTPYLLLIFAGILGAMYLALPWSRGERFSLTSQLSSLTHVHLVAPSTAAAQPPVESKEPKLDLNSLAEFPPCEPTPPMVAPRIDMAPIVVPDPELPPLPPQREDSLASIEEDFNEANFQPAPKLQPQKNQKKTQKTAKVTKKATPRQQQARRLAAQGKPSSHPAKPSASAGMIAKTKPSYRSAPKPPYPPSLRGRQAEGTVRVRISVSPAGKPTRVHVVASSGFREFDNGARSWIMSRWSFVPATENGRAIASTVTTRIHFTLRS